MKIGDHYDLARVTPADWQNLARSCALNEEQVISLLTEMARALPDAVSTALAQARTDGAVREGGFLYHWRIALSRMPASD